MLPASTALAGVGKIGGYFGGCVKTGQAIVIGVKAAPASYWRALRAASASGAVRCPASLSAAPRRATLAGGKRCPVNFALHSILTTAILWAVLSEPQGR